ncbi:hypothetical protein GCM10007423_21830 [Dyadobacter endophyticus]|uniref:Activator of Hsp90 ATPase homologue 1/2-like C-terminal domain-containing protein n=1 Tax=Dyadobacter endophyticus TaxID=1749036 RepID=A0ABQ1YN79_9BACT|nr:hypothetical protein GCM10007423_21830 [Dyadobacter endophyticus]
MVRFSNDPSRVQVLSEGKEFARHSACSPEQSTNTTAVLENPLIYLDITVNASAEHVWAVLTQPELIGKWMFDTPVEIDTEWHEGGKLREQGDLHGLPFENRGEIIRFDPPAALQYTHWSTLSLIPDVPQNYSLLQFQLQNIDSRTVLKLTISNLVTFEIFKHLEFYWKVALHLLREVAESLQKEDSAI